MTQEQFDKLPFLLSSGQACLALGTDYHGLKEFATAGKLTPFHQKTRHKANGSKPKWYKTELATLLKLKC